MGVQRKFEDELARGRTAEHVVAEILRQRGWYVIPSYDYTGDEGDKAPKMSGEKIAFVIPDLDACREGERKWAEVKLKSKPTLRRITGVLEHGIPLRHYRDYKKVQDESGCDVWIFICEQSTGKVLCQSLHRLGEPRIYDGNKMSKGGMAFWPRDSFADWTDYPDADR